MSRVVTTEMVRDAFEQLVKVAERVGVRPDEGSTWQLHGEQGIGFTVFWRDGQGGGQTRCPLFQAGQVGSTRREAWETLHVVRTALSVVPVQPAVQPVAQTPDDDGDRCRSTRPVCEGTHRPDDDPEPGDRCKDCGHRLTLAWEGPGPNEWVVSCEADHKPQVVRTWADGWGLWHAMVTTRGSLEEQREAALGAIVAEIRQRQGGQDVAITARTTRPVLVDGEENGTRIWSEAPPAP